MLFDAYQGIFCIVEKNQITVTVINEDQIKGGVAAFPLFVQGAVSDSGYNQIFVLHLSIGPRILNRIMDVYR